MRLRDKQRFYQKRRSTPFRILWQRAFGSVMRRHRDALIEYIFDIHPLVVMLDQVSE